MDDVLSALDAHVANHIVKHCLLGLLKNRTRIIVTEHRTLFFNANQVLRVANGIVSRSDINNGSTDSDYTLEETNDTPFDSASLDLEDDGKRSLDSVMMEEAKESGTLSPSVFAAYWKAMGRSMGVLVLLSVISMQFSRNLSDAWLANWVSNVDPNNLTATIDDYPSDHPLLRASGPLDASETDGNSTQNPATKFYLGIYAGIAVVNSILTLARSFLFAYAGIKAAKFIHTNLLHRVFYVRGLAFNEVPPRN